MKIKRKHSWQRWLSFDKNEGSLKRTTDSSCFVERSNVTSELESHQTCGWYFSGSPKVNRQRTLLSTLLVWAMLPLVVLSGSPRTACLCSNGALKLFCQRAQSQRSCCIDSERLENALSRSYSEEHSCCRESDRTPQSPPSCKVAGCRCTPVVMLPDAASKVESTAAPDFEVVVHYLSNEMMRVPHQVSPIFIRFHPTPPDEGRDLVILLSRMLA